MSKIDRVKNQELVTVSFNNVYDLDCFLGEDLAHNIPGYEARHKYDKAINNFNFAVLFKAIHQKRYKIWVIGTDGYFLERWGLEVGGKDAYNMLNLINEDTE